MKIISFRLLSCAALALGPLLLYGCSIMEKDKGKKAEATKAEHVRKGKAFLNEGKNKDAWIEFRNAEQLDPKDADVHFQLAVTYSRMKDFAAAFKEIQQAVELDPNNLPMQLMLANFYLVAATNDNLYFERAVKIADLIITKEPNNLEAYLLRGNAYAGMQNYDKAIDELQQILEKDPNRIPVYINLATYRVAQKDLDAAEATYKKALKLNENSFDANMALANFYIFRRKQFAEAEKILKRVYELYPKDARSSFSLAMFYALQRKWPMAEAVLVDATKKDPGNHEAKRTLASFYLATGSPDKGKQILLQLVKTNPDDLAARNRLAALYLDGKNLNEARPHIEHVLTKNSNDSEGQALKGRYRLLEGRLDEALSALNTARDLNPTSAHIYYLIGFAHFSRGDIAQATSSFTDAIKWDNNMFSARIGLAKTYLLNRQYDSARAEIDRVMEVQRNNVEALLTRGEIFILQDRLAEAREDYLQVIGLAPRNPAGHHRLGVIYHRQKQYEEALKKFEQALALDADLADAMNDIVAIYTAQKRDQQALERINKQIGQAGKKAPFYELQGKLYYRMKRLDDAEAGFRKALEADKNLMSSYFFLAQLLVGKGKDAPAAIAPLDGALKVNPKLPVAYALKGLVYDHFRDVENAKVNYKKALELEPDLAIAANNLAAIYSESARGDELDMAQFWAEKARQTVPDNPALADTLGWVYYKRASYPLAVDQLEFSVSKNPNNPVYHYHLGMTYYRMDKRAEAKKALQIALNLGEKTKFEGIDEARQVLRTLP